MTKAKTKKKVKAATKTSNPRKRVTFSVELVEVGEVYLVGDFNQWNPTAHPMKRLGDSLWEKTVMLAPGSYEYKFVVDGDWRIDAGNEETCPNCFGTWNNIVHIRTE